MSTTQFSSGAGFALMALSPEHILIGQPLAWPVYDADETPLLDAGEVVLTEQERDALFAWCRPHRIGPSPGPEPDPARLSFTVHHGGLDLVEPVHGMQLRLGHTVQIAPPPERGVVSATARVIGASPGGMLFVTAPAVSGTPWPLRPGQTLRLKTFSGTDICRFICTVESTHYVPTPYLVLSPPAQIQCTPIRSALRVRTKILARLRPRRRRNRRQVCWYSSTI